MTISVQVLVTEDAGRCCTATFTREFTSERGRAHLTAEETAKLVTGLSRDAVESAALLAGLTPAA